MEYVQIGKNRYAQVRVKADGSKYFLQNVCGVNRRIKLRSKNPRKLHNSPLPPGSRVRKMSGRGRPCSGKRKKKSKSPKKKKRSPKRKSPAKKARSPKQADILNLMDLQPSPISRASSNPFSSASVRRPPPPSRVGSADWWKL